MILGNRKIRGEFAPLNLQLKLSSMKLKSRVFQSVGSYFFLHK